MKRFVLFLIIIGIIGVGIFVLTANEEGLPEPRDTKLENGEPDTAAFFEPSETLVKNIIRNALDARFDSETATYKVADLDHKGGPELIIGAATENTATIQVLGILNQKGEYERIGKVEYQESMREAPEVKELTDIDGDGQEEIIMSLMYGGAASWTEGILDLDFATKTTRWVQLRSEEGKLQDAIFTLASSAAHSNAFHIQDADTDGKKEIVEIFVQTLSDQTECEVSAYEWNNTVFAFDKTLSEQTLQRLGADCAI
jgi:hypothetical protein